MMHLNRRDSNAQELHRLQLGTLRLILPTSKLGHRHGPTYCDSNAQELHRLQLGTLRLILPTSKLGHRHGPTYCNAMQYYS
jgi:hypothetical protein